MILLLLQLRGLTCVLGAVWNEQYKHVAQSRFRTRANGIESQIQGNDRYETGPEDKKVVVHCPLRS